MKERDAGRKDTQRESQIDSLYLSKIESQVLGGV